MHICSIKLSKNCNSVCSQGLVYEGAGEGRNWRGILLSLLVIGFVIMGIVLAIHTLGYVDELLYWSGRRMSLAELLGGELRPKRLPSAWLSPHHLLFQADDGSLALWSANSAAVVTLVTNHTMVSSPIIPPSA
jgi:inactive dipeptidyl peptidase 10